MNIQATHPHRSWCVTPRYGLPRSRLIYDWTSAALQSHRIEVALPLTATVHWLVCNLCWARFHVKRNLSRLHA